MESRILVIEDNSDIRENIEELLTLLGFAVTTADCGIKGLKLAQDELPDVILCDILMSGMDGFEVFKALRKKVKTRRIPFVFSTARSEKSESLLAKSLGINYYLVKPFGADELMMYINKALGTKRKLRNIS